MLDAHGAEHVNVLDLVRLRESFFSDYALVIRNPRALAHG